jgi:glutaredoxin/glutathione-dependent peroxiredoxin
LVKIKNEPDRDGERSVCAAVNPCQQRSRRMTVTIAIGETLPDGVLTEMIATETPGCAIGPNTFDVPELARNKRLIVFGVPGAFTPTCSAKHLPGYVANCDKFKAKRVDEIWCVAVNDAFVMDAWGKEQECAGRVRMMADGSATYTKALGLDMDLSARGMGIRSRRYSMFVENGVVRILNVEQPGKFEVSDAETMLRGL